MSTSTTKSCMIDFWEKMRVPVVGQAPMQDRPESWKKWLVLWVAGRLVTQTPHFARRSIGRPVLWTFLDTLYMVVTTTEEPFCAHGRLTTFVAWVDHERCTAIMAALRVHSALWSRWGGLHRDVRDGEDHLDQRREGGSHWRLIDGNVNIELRHGNAGEDLHGLDGIEWYGLNGPEYGWWRGRHHLWEEDAMTSTVERIQLHSNKHLDEWRWQIVNIVFGGSGDLESAGNNLITWWDQRTYALRCGTWTR